MWRNFHTRARIQHPAQGFPLHGTFFYVVTALGTRPARGGSLCPYALMENTLMKPYLKILLIDDDKDFGLILSYFLANKPFQFYVAHTLEEGMAMMEKERPDHIFLDNGLPDGFGWEKTDFILNTYPLVQLNLLSALIVPVNSTHTFRILEKPISTDKFMSCLAVA